MGIVLFAIIGETIDAGVGYWICYSIGCILEVAKFLINLVSED